MHGSSEAAKKWRPLILEMERSKKSARVWCSENNIRVNQFYYWRKKLNLHEHSHDDESSEDRKAKPRKANAPSGIAEIRLVIPQEKKPDQPLFKPEVMIKAEGLQLYVGAGFDDETLRKVLGVVKTC